MQATIVQIHANIDSTIWNDFELSTSFDPRPPKKSTSGTTRLGPTRSARMVPGERPQPRDPMAFTPNDPQPMGGQWMSMGSFQLGYIHWDGDHNWVVPGCSSMISIGGTQKSVSSALIESFTFTYVDEPSS